MNTKIRVAASLGAGVLIIAASGVYTMYKELFDNPKDKK